MDIITFGTGNLYGTATNAFDGTPLATPTPVKFANLQDVGFDFSFDEKLLYGSGQFPIGNGRGAGKIGCTAKTASVSADMYANLFLGIQPTQGIRAIAEDIPVMIPATPYQVTAAPPSTGTFVEDLGVIDAITGQPFTRVASAPATGQYTVSGSGVYLFAAADTGKPVTYGYEYSATSTTARFLPLTNKKMGYVPVFKAHLSTSYNGASITLVLNRCTSNKLSLPRKNDDFAVPDFDFSAFADGAGNIGYMGFSQ